MSEEVTEGRRKLHNEELRDLSTRIIISGYQIKKEMGGATGTLEEKRKVHTGFWLETPKERDHVEDLRTDGMKKKMKWILKKKIGRKRLRFI